MEQGRSVSMMLNKDLWSKLTDGILVMAILCLTWLIVELSVKSIIVFGMPGLLVFVLGLLAVAMYAFQQALATRRADTTRAWYGIAGGFLSWAVVSVCAKLGLPVRHPAGMILIIMVSLIVGLLWRSYLPIGARFFSLTFLLNWASSLIIAAEERLAVLSPIFTLAYRATGYLAILLAVLVTGWILFQSERRIQRISAALGVWFLLSLVMYVFRGSLF